MVPNGSWSSRFVKWIYSIDKSQCLKNSNIFEKCKFKFSFETQEKLFSWAPVKQRKWHTCHIQWYTVACLIQQRRCAASKGATGKMQNPAVALLNSVSSSLGLGTWRYNVSTKRVGHTAFWVGHTALWTLMITAYLAPHLGCLCLLPSGFCADNPCSGHPLMPHFASFS